MTNEQFFMQFDFLKDSSNKKIIKILDEVR